MGILASPSTFSVFLPQEQFLSLILKMNLLSFYYYITFAFVQTNKNSVNGYVYLEESHTAIIGRFDLYSSLSTSGVERTLKQEIGPWRKDKTS